MIINLKRDFLLRSAAIEILATKVVRKENKNNFVIRVVNFRDLSGLANYYRLDLSQLNHVEIINKYYRSFDLVEFVLNNKDERIVKEVIIYEVKSCFAPRTEPLEFSEQSHKRILELGELGIKTNLIVMKLLDLWLISFNIYDYESYRCKRIRTMKDVWKKKLISPAKIEK